MRTTQRYCLDCQHKFDVVPDELNCPRCGGTWHDWMHMPTIDSEFMSESLGQDDQDDAPDEFLDTEFDKYHIHEFLGQGGMARVYRAQDLALERPCAIKVLRETTLQRDTEAIASFLAEARSAAALMHPHVVTIHTIGDQRGRHFIEMEYIDGPSLADHVRAVGRLEPLDATNFMLQICSALEVAHDMGMVHRDIKPANVMVARSMHAKLADFGLAKRLAKSPGPNMLLSGTPSFMAPELFKGEPASKASDVYAVGVTYFSLLTGRLPVAARSVNDLVKFHDREQSFELNTLAPELPPQIIELVESCLAKSPMQRYEDARALGLALRRLFGSLRSLDGLLEEALAGDPVEIRDSGDGFEVLVALPNARSQKVIIELVRPQPDVELVRIYSICGRAVADQYEHALEMNAVIPHGALAIEEINGERCFVAVDTYPRATCDPPEVRESVLTIAANADRLESQLHGEDHF
ncbi:MAG: protein kinase [Pirellulaceae bacterium]|nr:protein kinase [Pirellulaceae bacterium]